MRFDAQRLISKIPQNTKTISTAKISLICNSDKIKKGEVGGHLLPNYRAAIYDLISLLIATGFFKRVKVGIYEIDWSKKDALK